MAKGPRQIGETMRPNIQISHALNGRVKDFAAEHGLNVDVAYRLIILEGLERLESMDSDEVRSLLEE